MAESGSTATYLNKRYQQQYAYNAETTYVAGEFYWQVERGQKTFNRDFASGVVAAAFKLDAKKDMFKRGDALPVSAASGLGCGTIILIIIVVIIIILLIILSTCSRGGSSSGYRSTGGSYGGYSSGGGHK